MRLPVLSAAVLVALVAAPDARAGTWARPVPGSVTRGFDFRGDPFAAGQHRGADLDAPRGATVRAPCDGRVAVAGRIGSSGGVVTVACGPWRASVLPLGRIDVRAGARVRAGQAVGSAGAGSIHDGIHLGVRRAGRRFGYVDPLRFLRRRPPVPPPPFGVPGRGLRARRWPSIPAPSVPALHAATRATVAPRAAPGDAGLPLAPWPAWTGAALLLAAASGGVVRRRARHRSAAGRAAAVRARTRRPRATRA